MPAAGCAIIGWVGSISSPLLNEFFRRAESSGPMSTGLLSVKDGSVELWKRAVPASYMLRNHNHRVNRAAASTTGIGHTRWATHGQVIDQNAHPFTHNGIHFVHNGVISNYQRILPSAVVDSQCLGPLIEQRDLSPANGSVGLAWLEHVDGQWRLFVYRHSQNLTVSKIITRDMRTAVLIASRQNQLPRKDVLVTEQFDLAEGVAYEITEDGPIEAWRNPHEARRFVRATYQNGQYIGG